MVLSKRQERFKIYRDMNRVCNLAEAQFMDAQPQMAFGDHMCTQQSRFVPYVWCVQQKKSLAWREKGRGGAHGQLSFWKKHLWRTHTDIRTLDRFLCAVFLSLVIPNTCCVICGLQRAGQVSGFKCSAALRPNAKRDAGLIRQACRGTASHCQNTSSVNIKTLETSSECKRALRGGRCRRRKRISCIVAAADLQTVNECDWGKKKLPFNLLPFSSLCFKPLVFFAGSEKGLIVRTWGPPPTPPSTHPFSIHRKLMSGSIKISETLFYSCVNIPSLFYLFSIFFF